MWNSVLCHHPLGLYQWLVVLTVTLVAVLYDLRIRLIPNWLTLPFFFCGLGVAWGVSGWAGLSDALVGAILLAVPYIVLYLFAGGGAGDAKLMGALGAWLGLSNSILLLVAVTSSGAILGLLYALLRGQLGVVLGNLRVMVMSLVWCLGQRQRPTPALFPAPQKMLKIPYGVAIFAGTCITAGGVILWRI